MKKNKTRDKLNKKSRKKLNDDAVKFEQIVARIYQSLSPSAIVKHNDKINERQIDISIRSKICGHDVLIIINTKNQSRPANINQVGELYAVMDDVKAHKGVLICNKGFTKGAKKFAETRGIDLCHIHDAETREWTKELMLPVVLEEITPRLSFNFQIHIEEDVTVSNDFFFHISGLNMSDKFISDWNSGKISLNESKQAYKHNIENPTIRTLAGFDIPIKNLNILITLESSFFFGYYSMLPTAKALLNETSNSVELIIPQTDIETLDKSTLLKIDSLEAAPVIVTQHLRILKAPLIEYSTNYQFSMSKI